MKELVLHERSCLSYARLTYNIEQFSLKDFILQIVNT